MNEISRLREQLGTCLPRFAVALDEPLCKHTSFRIGGPAELMVFPRRKEELAAVLRLTHALGVRPRILGAGTNVLAPDEGVRGCVICLRDTFMGLELTDETHIRAMSGMSLAKTAMFAAQNRLSGLEFAHGIPGTVGGGIYMNAGAYGGELCGAAVSTEFMHLNGETEVFAGEAQGFAYRTSVFQKLDGVIVSASFALRPDAEAQIRQRMHALNARRRASQPLDKPSAGSTFKRPQGGYAAKLIDDAGLKGLCVGGAAVSEKHAGFVVNNGGATAADVLELIERIQKRVLEHSGILLEPEVRLWGRE